MYRPYLSFFLRYIGEGPEYDTRFRTRQDVVLGGYIGDFLVVGLGWEGDRFVVNIV